MKEDYIIIIYIYFHRSADQMWSKKWKKIFGSISVERRGDEATIAEVAPNEKFLLGGQIQQAAQQLRDASLLDRSFVEPTPTSRPSRPPSRHSRKTQGGGGGKTDQRFREDPDKKAHFGLKRRKTPNKKPIAKERDRLTEDDDEKP